MDSPAVLRASLIASGVTVDDVGLIAAGKPAPSGGLLVVRVDGAIVRLIGVPDAQRDAATKIVQAWDFSPAAVADRAAKSQREEAKAALRGPSPTQRATRAAVRVLYGSIVEMRHAFNALRLYVQGQGQLPSALSIRTWEQALAAAEQQIDADS